MGAVVPAVTRSAGAPASALRPCGSRTRRLREQARWHRHRTNRHGGMLGGISSGGHCPRVISNPQQSAAAATDGDASAKRLRSHAAGTIHIVALVVMGEAMMGAAVDHWLRSRVSVTGIRVLSISPSDGPSSVARYIRGTPKHRSDALDRQ